MYTDDNSPWQVPTRRGVAALASHNTTTVAASQPLSTIITSTSCCYFGVIICYNMQSANTDSMALDGAALTSCPSCEGRLYTVLRQRVALWMTLSEGESFIVPRRGTYIVFQLNPLGMVEPLGNTETVEEANRLCTKKYIGFVFNVSLHPLIHCPTDENAGE